MTACTNKARGAVVAALAGALALGAAPAVALASGSDVALFAVSGSEAFKDAELTGATDNKGGTVDVEDAIEFEASDGTYLVPTEITPKQEGAAPVTIITSGEGQNAYIGYYKDNNGKLDESNRVYPDQGALSVGTYWVRIRMMGDAPYAGATFEVQFSIVNNSLKDSTAYFCYDGRDDVTETDIPFVKSGASISDFLGIALDGDALKYRTDYEFTGNYVDATTGKLMGSTADLSLPGSYRAEIEGVDGSKYEGSTAWVDFTVSPVNLSSPNVSIADTKATDPGEFDVTVDGITYGADLFDFTITSGGDLSTNGAKTYTVKAKDPDKGIVTGSASVTLNKVENVVSADDIKYDDTTTNYFSSSTTEDIDLSTDAPVDVTKFVATNVENEDLDVTVWDSEGNERDASVLKTAGTWTIKVRVNAAATEFEYGSATKEFTVTNTNGSIASADIAFVFDGEVAATKTVAYDGTDQLDKLQVTVKDASGKTLVEGTDYTLEVKAGDKAVDEAVNVDSYTVTVKSDSYKIDEGIAKFQLTITQVTLDSAKVVNDFDNGTEKFLVYTGDVLTPDYVFTDDEGNEVTLPADAYEVAYEYAGESDVELKDVCKGENTYTATITLVGDYAKNYKLTDTKVGGIVVSDQRVFLDVPANEWYSQAVYKAAELGFMNGDGGAKTFSPMRSLTRAEAVCVLFNMAGGDGAYDNLPGYNADDKVYETGFSDVAGNEFYAKAIAWAKATGVANGYADGTFGVSRNVTSEEFACMLANYARAMGDYEAVDADEVLAGYADASSVSDWARDSVAWAVSEGVMGNSAELAPSGSILRMRVAAMVTNYQDYKADSALIEIKKQ